MTAEDNPLRPLLPLLLRGQVLSEQQAYEAFTTIMSGLASGAQIGSLLTALQCRPGGPAVDEIVGAARAMRAHANPVPVPPGLSVIDTCGTGGDHAGTFNISTAAALVAAGAGAYVAKHGNRSVTSQSGSSQVLEALGVNLSVSPETLGRCLAETHLCFCFAPAHHPAMKHAVGPRRELGFRTIFNVLGPLTNPAGTRRQIIGVFEEALTEPIALALLRLGSEHAMVVHGSGLDEISTLGPTRISTLHAGRITTRTFTADQLGLPAAKLDDLKVDSVQASAAVVRRILAGEQGPARDIVTLNAAAALVVADLAADLAAGLAKARAALDSGSAAAVLDTLVKITCAS